MSERTEGRGPGAGGPGLGNDLPAPSPQPPTPARMRLTILNDTTQRDRCTWCSATWSTPADVAFIVNRLQERYGGLADVVYVDAGRDPLHDDDLRVVELARERGLPLPIVAIDGSIKLIGAADYRAIAEAIEVQGGE